MNRDEAIEYFHYYKECPNGDYVLNESDSIDMINKIYDDFESKEKQTEKEFAIHLAKTIESIGDDFENRTCESCKYFNIGSGSYYGACDKHVNTTKNKEEWLSNIEFSCNRWESK